MNFRLCSVKESLIKFYSNLFCEVFLKNRLGIFCAVKLIWVILKSFLQPGVFQSELIRD